MNIVRRPLFYLFLITILSTVLRFYSLSSNPPGLYIDEVSIGYNAYIILTTGKDEHGVSYPLTFQAFGEYKLPVYIYMVSASMAFFGKNEFAVRLPSAFFGTSTVVLLYFFMLQICSYVSDAFIKKHRYQISGVSAFLLAISPWHIQFSRAGFEATVALFFYLLGILLAMYFFNKQRTIFLLLSVISLIVALYTYNVYRILTPLTLLSICLFFLQTRTIRGKQLLWTILLSIGISFPMLLFSFSSQGMARFSDTSAFSSLSSHPLWMNLSLYLLTYVSNYLSYFSPLFLFVHGDQIGRHQMPGFSELPLWELPFLLIGLYVLCQQKFSLGKNILVVFLLVSPLVPALTIPSPHALRSLPMVIPLTCVCTMGLVFFFSIVKKYALPMLMMLLIIATYSFFYYLHFYYEHYPTVNIYDWGSGYKEIVQSASALRPSYQQIVIDEKFSYAKIYFDFYDPTLHPLIVSSSWKKPVSWKDGSVLYIRPNYGDTKDPHIIKSLMLPNPNHDIYAEFWKI